MNVLTGKQQCAAFMCSYFLQCLVLWCGSAVVRVLLRTGHCVHVLSCAVTVLLVLVGELLDVAVSFAGAEPAYRAGQPLP